MGRDAVLEPAFVLHGRAYRNTSRLLEVLSRDHGRIGLVARGAAGPRSRLAGLLQPFRPLAMTWQARGELGTLQTAEPAGAPLALQGRRLVSGFYGNELLIRLLGREDPHPGLFECYVGYLEALTTVSDEAVAVRAFERDLLGLLGYGLALTVDADDQPVVPEGWYRYDPGRGAVPVAGPNGGGVIVSGDLLIGLAVPRPSSQVARASRALMRAAMAPHLGDRPLRSRELYARYPTGGRQHGSPSRQS